MRDAGIGEVGIIVGDTQAEIRAAVGDGSAFGLAVTYIPQDAPWVDPFTRMRLGETQSGRASFLGAELRMVFASPVFTSR